MAMAGAVLAPSSPISSVLSSHDACSTSCAPLACLNPPSRLKFSPLCTSRYSSNVSGFSIASTAPSVWRNGFSYMALWHGRSHLGNVQFFKTVAGRHWQSRRSIAGRVHASLLGVGAPEVLVIAVVALVVFGPKGLAEVVRAVGKSLKAFQPTIQELQQVSREFKSTLEEEIGFDEFRNPKPVDRPPVYQKPAPVQNEAPEAKAYTADDYSRVTEEQAKTRVAEDLRREAKVPSWGGSPSTKTPEQNVSEEAAVEHRNLGDES